MSRSAILSILALSAGSAFAQHISVGIKGGAALTDAFDNQTNSTASGIIQTYSSSKDYVIGPMLEVRLPFGLGVEADALFRPYYLNNKITIANLNTLGSESVHAWEFPLLVKYKLPAPIVKPYVAAGPSFRAAGSSGDGLSGKGFALGAGIEIKALALRVSPELRYTHWAESDPLTSSSYPALAKQNQVEVLVGLTF